MADKTTSPGVFSNENLSSEYLGRDVDAFKRIEIRNKLRQSLPVPVLPNQNINQGSVNLRLPEPPQEKESVILKKLVLDRDKQGLTPLPVRKAPAKVSPVKLSPFAIFFHTSDTLVKLFSVFEHTSDIQVKPFSVFEHNSRVLIKPFSVFEHDSTVTVRPFNIFEHSSTVVITKFGIFVHTSPVTVTPFGVFTHTSNVKPTAFGIFEHDSYTITTPLEIQQHFSATADRTPYTLDFRSLLAVPVIKQLFRTTISLADRLRQSGLGTTRHLPQYFLSDLFADYIKVIPFGVYTHFSPLGLLTFDFAPSQGGLFPNIFDFDSQSAQGIFIGSGGLLVSSTVVDTPIEQILPLQGVLLQNNVFVSPIQPVTPILDFILQQGGVLINNDLFSFVSTDTPISPEGLPKNGVTPTLAPSPLANTQAQTDASQEPQVLTYSLDRLLAATLPRVKHGSATLPTTTFNTDISPQQGSTTVDENASFLGINEREQEKIDGSPDLTNIEYQADRAEAENEPVKKHGDADSSTLGPLKEQNFGPGEVITSKINPITGTPQILPEGGPEGSSFVQLPEPTQGAPNSSQPQTLANSSTFTHTGGDLTKYKTLSYGEIFQKASSGQKTAAASAVFSPAVEVEGDNDFVNITINGIRFRSFITSFNESYSPTWSDIRYVGVQDVLKQFTGVTRAASLGFKTVAFSRTDLQNLYLKLNRLAAETCIGSYSGVYLTPPITTLTVGNWFVNTPCTTNSLKFDVNVAEEPWDIGQAGVDEDTNPQMPKIVAVTMDFTILGTNAGAPLNRNDGPYISYASIVASGLGAG